MKLSDKKHSGKIFFLKIDLPALMALVLFAGLIFFYLIPGFEKVMMDRKRTMIREMTASAYSLLEYYHSQAESGKIEPGEAKRQAWSAISTIRYGDEDKDYFWITDSKPEMIMHPYRQDLNGKDLSDFRDSKGKLIFIEFVRAVASSGESYVEYMWQWNDDSTRIVPKLSYVRLFEPWNWVIGTGIYIEDVRSEIRKIELSALVISGSIGLVIIILLSAISRQSHKIEQGRKRAEMELQRSRELYRTLAEAATEGVLIWSRQGLQANRTLLTWLDYSEHELLEIPVRELFNLSEIVSCTDPELFYDDLESRRQEECLLKTKNGHLISYHAGFSRISLGELKAVLVVFRPVKVHTEKAVIEPSSSLLDRIGTGFFRVSFGKRNRFIYASEPLILLLGYNTLHELSTKSVESFFANPEQLKVFLQSLAQRKDILSKSVLIKTKTGDEFRAFLNITVTEINSTEILCDGTLEPVTISSSGIILPSASLTRFSTSYLMNIPVSSVMRSPFFSTDETSVFALARTMKKEERDVAIITDNKGNPTGVVDEATIGRMLAEGNSGETAVFGWMYSSPEMVKGDLPSGRAFSMIMNAPCNCLLVTGRNDEIEGIITRKELTELFSNTPELLMQRISEADSGTTLSAIWKECSNLASCMIAGNADASSVTMFISKIADEICRRIITITIDETGAPPCKFAFIQTGSAGRMEQTLLTDQDNAIIYENIDNNRTEKVNDYFLNLGKRVNHLLAEAGFRSCKGDNMAGNPQWCKPLDAWKNYFSEWIRIPGPEELLEISIFFDFRFCFGNPELPEELKDFILKGLKTNDIFFHHMAAVWKQFTPYVSTIPSGKSDIKKMLMPLVGITRLYALRHAVQEYTTIERLIELHSGGNLEKRMMDDSITAWKELTFIRLAHQINCINTGTEPDNIVDFNSLGNDNHYLAAKSLTSVNNLLLKVSGDFWLENL